MFVLWVCQKIGTSQMCGDWIPRFSDLYKDQLRPYCYCIQFLRRYKNLTILLLLLSCLYIFILSVSPQGRGGTPVLSQALPGYLPPPWWTDKMKTLPSLLLRMSMVKTRQPPTVLVLSVFKPHFCFFVSFFFCMCVFLCSFLGQMCFYTIAIGNFFSAIWDTTHWHFFVKFGLKTAWVIS